MVDFTHTPELSQDIPETATPADTPSGHPLLLEISGTEQKINPESLLDEEFAGNILHMCNEVSEPPVANLQYLLDWTDDGRWEVLKLFKNLSPHLRARASASAAAQMDVFQVVLFLLVG